MSAVIASIGLATPKATLSQEEALDMARRLSGGCASEWLGERGERIYRGAAIERRGAVLFDGDETGLYASASDGEDRGPTTAARVEVYRRWAGELGAQAGGRALEGMDRGEVTHIVTASCTGAEAPGVDQDLVRLLGLGAGVERTHIGFMGCHAAINALRVARAIVCADQRAVVLVCCVELCSLHYQYGGRTAGVVANALFADGAAAAVVRNGGGSGGAGLFAIEGTASQILPDSRGAMGWRIGDHGFEMELSIKTPVLLARAVPAWIERWLATLEVVPSGVRWWAVHPGGPRVLDEIASSLGLDADAVGPSREVLREHGNMSSATVLFVLERIARRAEAGQRCVAMAFGPGLAGEACLLRRGNSQ